MPFYGFVSPGIRIVTSNYDEIRGLIKSEQYPNFRKFYKRWQAIQFVADNAMEFKLERLKKYGECFQSMYLTIEYFIQGSSVYYNIFTNRLGNVDLSESKRDPSMLIEKRNGIIMVEMKGMNLNPNLIISHAMAIQNVLRLVGSFVDVELIIPNHSIFYLINSYQGDFRPYTRFLEFIRARKGRLALTMENWGGYKEKR